MVILGLLRGLMMSRTKDFLCDIPPLLFMQRLVLTKIFRSRAFFWWLIYPRQVRSPSYNLPGLIILDIQYTPETTDSDEDEPDVKTASIRFVPEDSGSSRFSVVLLNHL